MPVPGWPGLGAYPGSVLTITIFLTSPEIVASDWETVLETTTARYAGTLEELAQCIEAGWLHGTPVRDRSAWQFIYVIQNHDQVGNRAFGERLHHQIDMARYRAASALLAAT